jgi:hypothetical protein
MTTVVHFNDVKQHWNWRLRRWDAPEYVYIGRRMKDQYLPPSPWANPFRLHTDSATARAHALEQYRQWITQSEDGQKLLPKLPALRNKILVCWCAPKPCHGHVLLELLGEKPHIAAAAQTALDGKTIDSPPILLWDNGMAGYRIEKDKSGRLVRSSQEAGRQSGMPGMVYLEWEEWYRDYLKETLRVRGCAPASGMSHSEYASFRYAMRLKGLEGRDDERSEMEYDILHELLAELKGETDATE